MEFKKRAAPLTFDQTLELTSSCGRPYSKTVCMPVFTKRKRLFDSITDLSSIVVLI